MEGFGKGECPQCHGQFHFPLEAQGVPASCPRCQHVFVLAAIVDSPATAKAGIRPQQTPPSLPGSSPPSTPVMDLLRVMTGGWMFRVFAAGVLVLIAGFTLSRSNPSLLGKSDEEARFMKMLREHESRAQVEETAKGNGETTVTVSWPELGGAGMTAAFFNGRLQTAQVTQRIFGGASFRVSLENSSLLAGVACGVITTTLRMTEKECTELQTWYLKPVTAGQLADFGSRVVQSGRFGPAECESTWELTDVGFTKNAPQPRLESRLDFRRR